MATAHKPECQCDQCRGVSDRRPDRTCVRCGDGFGRGDGGAVYDTDDPLLPELPLCVACLRSLWAWAGIDDDEGDDDRGDQDRDDV